MDLKSWLSRSPLIAILRGVTPNEVEAIAEVLAAEGIRIVEVPLNSPTPFDSIERLTHAFGDDLLIGAGTVRRPEEVEKIAGLGGKLIVTPHAEVAVTRAAKAARVFSVPGFMTPTEAFSLIDAGADALKLFPAEAASPAVLKAMSAVLPKSVPIIPVGGMSAETIGPWRAAGAAGFGCGSSLYASGDGPEEVRGKARRLVEALKRAGDPPRRPG